MQRFCSLLSLLIILSSCSLFVNEENSISQPENPDTGEEVPYNQEADMWVSAYLGAWNHYAPPGGNWGNLSTDEIDWDAFTHLFYFAINAKADGSLSEIKEYNTFSPSRLNAIVEAAHKHDTAILFSVGGWGNYEEFRSAIMPENRDAFINNLISTMEEWGFDGIDVDMEPIKDETDVRNYTAFINKLHQQLQNKTTPLGIRPLLTAATDWKPDMFAELSDKFDQINLMTYDMSGAWHKWVSWHNAPVYDGDYKFPGTNKTVPSADGEVEKFVEAGVPKEKLGIGIDFYGYIWQGFVTGPRQNWSVEKPVVKPNVPYYIIKEEYYSEDYYHWDDTAKAAYLSIDHAIPLQKRFISYDDEKSIEAKINYVRDKGIGGTIIWDLTGGYQKNQPDGKRDPLLQKVKEELWRGAK